MGEYVTAGPSSNTIAIGSGAGNSTRLTNDIENSMLVGFENVPTLFVGGSDNRVGIGTTTPAQLLDVAGTAQVLGFKMPTGAYPGYVLVTDTLGNGTWQDAGGTYDDDWVVSFSGDHMWSAVPYNVGIGIPAPGHNKLDVRLSASGEIASSAIHGQNYGSDTEGYLATEDYGVHGIVSDLLDEAVYGENTETSTYGYIGGQDYGVFGVDGETNNWGYVGGPNVGVGAYSTDGKGVHGISITDYAGYFTGNVHVTGAINKGACSFVIDHPLDPENKLLRHNCIESPENLLVYRGKVELDGGGHGTVTLPEYFAALAKEDEATVTITPIGEPFLVGYNWEPGLARFTAHGQPNREVSWVVYADRDDPVINRLRRPVEDDKGPTNRLCDKGELLYPEAYGYPASAGADRMPAGK
jgi:hypothetical protein